MSKKNHSSNNNNKDAGRRGSSGVPHSVDAPIHGTSAGSSADKGGTQATSNKLETGMQSIRIGTSDVASRSSPSNVPAPSRSDASATASSVNTIKIRVTRETPLDEADTDEFDLDSDVSDTEVWR